MTTNPFSTQENSDWLGPYEANTVTYGGVFTIEGFRRNITQRNDQWESAEAIQGQLTLGK